jgi:hypothetical protein
VLYTSKARRSLRRLHFGIEWIKIDTCLLKKKKKKKKKKKDKEKRKRRREIKVNDSTLAA